MVKFSDFYDTFPVYVATTTSSGYFGRLDRDDVACSALPLIQQIGPLLHYLGAILQIVGMVQTLNGKLLDN